MYHFVSVSHSKFQWNLFTFAVVMWQNAYVYKLCMYYAFCFLGGCFALQFQSWGIFCVKTFFESVVYEPCVCADNIVLHWVKVASQVSEPDGRSVLLEDIVWLSSRRWRSGLWTFFMRVWRACCFHSGFHDWKVIAWIVRAQMKIGPFCVHLKVLHIFIQFNNRLMYFIRIVCGTTQTRS